MTTRWRGRWIGAVVVAVLAASCAVDEAARERCGEGASCATTTVTDPAESSTPILADDVPIVNGPVDTGCVDEVGVLSATTAAWYPDGSVGALALSGEPVESDTGRAFVGSVRSAMLSLGDRGAVVGAGRDLAAVPGGCPTHHEVSMALGDGQVVVTAWRLMGAAGLFSWLPSEGAFALDGPSTLLSTGPHVTVVLEVAPDGTTVRVSAYGAHSRDAMAGWPTTTPAPADAPEWGPAPLSGSEARDLAAVVMADLLAARSGD